MSALSVKVLGRGEEKKWDRFVEQLSEATFFHKSGWRGVLEESLGHETYYFFTERDGEITGILPLVFINSRLFGKRLSSLAFCDAGGPAYRDLESKEALLSEAVKLGEDLGVDYIECRCALKTRSENWRQRADLYASFRQRLEQEPEANMSRLHRKRRAMIRKGISLGLYSRIENDVSHLHELFAESVLNLGTPVLPKAYFKALKKAFPNESEVMIIEKDGKPVSAVLSFRFRDAIMPYHGGGTKEARDLAANDFMYWEVMRRAAEAGLSWFDFGRAKVGTGSYDFKKNWGFEPKAITHSYWLHKATEVPEINPLNPKYKLFIALWKHLPLGLSKTIGPYLVRNLG